jgi:AraC family transcriptional regulator
MDWIRGLQRAIDYMEANICEELDAARVAEQAYSSSFHFQRTFNLLTGITVGEYIRNRRLSLAGEELAVSNAKVIDVAYKYGYDTPESFTKAFSRFHGVTPSAARQPGANLKSFNRLSITITMKGGNVMEYQIIKKESFSVLAKAKNFPTDSIDNGIGEFWTQCDQDGTIEVLCSRGKKDATALLGLCEPEKKGEKTFCYGIGIECEKDTEVPVGYEMWQLPAQTWVVFKCIGAMPKAIQDMWKRAYSEFFPQSEYEPLDAIDFEAYPDGDTKDENYICDIWIPVRKRSE